MDIFINEQPAGITLESEKTLGEVLAGIEAWLGGSENRISGLRINGSIITGELVAAVFEQDLKDIERLDITISTLPQLALEALYNSQEALRAYENSSFEDRQGIQDGWEASAAANFVSEQIPDIYALLQKAFSGEMLLAKMHTLLDERIRELVDPSTEFHQASTLISSIAARLEELPLDIQTGKDRRAAETVQLFSHAAEKLFRLLKLLCVQGLALETLSIDTLPFYGFISEFSATLKELLAAYTAQDVVLVGDLAEYELSPRLLKLYTTVKDELT
ncbi:MAG: hypothetical protein LBF75_07360 [Treponema sp.]|jgi:hypothetical protein|nr:hypothetical protein [Treponema sp.]